MAFEYIERNVREVTEKIEDNKLQDVEIDAISLEAFTKADKNIIKII